MCRSGSLHDDGVSLIVLGFGFSGALYMWFVSFAMGLWLGWIDRLLRIGGVVISLVEIFSPC